MILICLIIILTPPISYLLFGIMALKKAFGEVETGSPFTFLGTLSTLAPLLGSAAGGMGSMGLAACCRLGGY